jgi:membrane protein implicated in regulation of membrane protease activity
MFDFVQNLHWWHWWIAGAVLAALETFLSGAVAIWFGVAALVVGTLLLLVPGTPWPLQIVLFGALGAATLLLWRKYKNPEEGKSDQPTLNHRGVHYIGQVFTLVEPIAAGTGKIQVGDTVWLAQGNDAPRGARVRVVGVNGAVLKVEPT